jgi:glucose dehydrogenase
MHIVKRQVDPVTLVRALVVGLYAWLVAVSFGLAWLDIQYARLLPDAAEAFREVADVLLFVMFVTTLAGIGAVGLSWNTRVPRDLLAASLVIVLVAPFVALLVLSPEARESSATGSVVRLSISGAASVLAFAGFHRIGRSG